MKGKTRKKVIRERGGLTPKAGITLVHQRRESSRMANGRENNWLTSYPSVQHLSCPSELYLKGKRP